MLVLPWTAQSQPSPMLNHPFSEEILPGFEPFLVQLEAMLSYPVAAFLGEEGNLGTISFQEVIQSEKVTPEPPPLQAKQPQLP